MMLVFHVTFCILEIKITDGRISHQSTCSLYNCIPINVITYSVDIPAQRRWHISVQLLYCNRTHWNNHYCLLHGHTAGVIYSSWNLTFSTSAPITGSLQELVGRLFSSISVWNWIINKKQKDVIVAPQTTDIWFWFDKYLLLHKAFLFTYSLSIKDDDSDYDDEKIINLLVSSVILLPDVITKSMCQPREVLLDIFQEYPEDTEHTYVPSCVVLNRCGGCCNDEAMECIPTETCNVTLQVSPGSTSIFLCGFQVFPPELNWAGQHGHLNHP